MFATGSGMIHLTGIAGMPWCAKVHTVTALFARLQLHKALCPMIVEIRTAVDHGAGIC